MICEGLPSSATGRPSPFFTLTEASAFGLGSLGWPATGGAADQLPRLQRSALGSSFSHRTILWLVIWENRVGEGFHMRVYQRGPRSLPELTPTPNLNHIKQPCCCMYVWLYVVASKSRSHPPNPVNKMICEGLPSSACGRPSRFFTMAEACAFGLGSLGWPASGGAADQLPGCSEALLEAASRTARYSGW